MTKREEYLRKKFDEYMVFIFKREGGLTDHPSDPGSLTKFGIAQAFYPNLDIRNLTKEDAKEIYWNDYFNRHGVGDIPEKLQLAFFDCVVNQGGRKAKTTLQKAINLQADAFGFYPIAVDGLVGPITIGTANRVNSNILLLDFIRLRLDHYRKISFRAPFIRGWENRVEDLLNNV